MNCQKRNERGAKEIETSLRIRAPKRVAVDIEAALWKAINSATGWQQFLRRREVFTVARNEDHIPMDMRFNAVKSESGRWEIHVCASVPFPSDAELLVSHMPPELPLTQDEIDHILSARKDAAVPKILQCDRQYSKHYLENCDFLAVMDEMAAELNGRIHKIESELEADIYAEIGARTQSPDIR